MKLTQEVIDQIQEAMNHTKMNGDPNWNDGDEIEVQLAGTFAADKFIVLKNKTKNPVPPFVPHDGFDYEKLRWKDGRSAGYNQMKTLEDYFFIGLILLEEFVKRTLIGIYYTCQKFDYWNFNRKLPK